MYILVNRDCIVNIFLIMYVGLYVFFVVNLFVSEFKGLYF